MLPMSSSYELDPKHLGRLFFNLQSRSRVSDRGFAESALYADWWFGFFELEAAEGSRESEPVTYRDAIPPGALVARSAGGLLRTVSRPSTAVRHLRRIDCGCSRLS